MDPPSRGEKGIFILSLEMVFQDREIEAMSPKRAPRFVAYYRVSTDRQGKSGLGLAAQQKSVRDYLNGGSWELVGEYTEVESGKRADRPELAKAIEACRKQKAKLVIAKLDRLSRNLSFVAALIDSGVEFLAADNPHANKLTIHILAAVAQHEREMISERTKSALQAAKARGKVLGNPRLSDASAKGRAVTAAAAQRFAENLMPVIREIRAAGATSNAAIAEKLNERRIPTARGGKWAHVQVGAILNRAGQP
jgi:DNA invertase Pin-like site-specific DNA recombinase